MPAGSHPVLYDFETRSRCDLKKNGGRAYWAHPSTSIICASWYDTHDGSRGTWVPGEQWPRHGRLLGAHNAEGFDRFGAVREGWAAPEDDYIDTMQLARRAGLPGSLDALGKRWLGRDKDKEGSRLTIGLSTCRRPSGKKNPDAIAAADWKALSNDDKRVLGVQKELTPEILGRVIQYCESDVDILEHGWPLLESWRDVDEDVSRVSRIVNDRGVGFDSDLARALLRCDVEHCAEVLAAVGADLGETPEETRRLASSNTEFTRITGAPNAQKATVAELDHPLAQARQALATIARGKLEAGLARVCPDGRLYDSLVYYGAHTGRYSAKGFQLHNMNRPLGMYEEWSSPDIDRLAEMVICGAHTATPDETNLLLRATLHAKAGHTLVVSDFSGVEARCLSWCADDHAALAVIASGEDPYKHAAVEIYGGRYADVSKGQRAVGKVARLACGYGGGWRAYEKMGKGLGVDLSGIDTREVVRAWRRAHQPVVKFWYACERAWKAACAGREAWLDCFRFAPADDGSDIAVFLPSGRPIVYCDAHVTSDGSLAYLGTKGMTEHVYGGLLTENLIQALCRDLMTDALVRCEADGLRPVMHVHDEIVNEVARDAAKDAASHLHNIMTTVPEWAEGFPIGASGWVGDRFRK